MKRVIRYIPLFVSLMMAAVCICGCNEGARASTTLYDATSPQLNAISSFASKPGESLTTKTSAISPASSVLDESKITTILSFTSKPEESLTTKTSAVSSASSELDEAVSSQVGATASATRKTTADRTLWKRKMIAITFDDGPHETNPQLLDMLKKKDVKVTFFMLGQNMEKRPEIVKRAIEDGHDIGWHSYQYRDIGLF